MGVNSLWDIVGPTARPVRLESLSRKKLAVDASIWIYQFLKAVRDSDGNSLPQSHIVGFFRRICKLLYFGILPVFVFDGGAPALKRQTILKRRERRQGKTESTMETARKLLAIQVQKLAERLKKRHRLNGEASASASEGKTPQSVNTGDTVYLDDLQNLHPSHQKETQETSNNRPDISTENSTENLKEGTRFRKNDEFHLPHLDSFRSERDDGRLMPEEEFLGEIGLDSNYVDGVNINTVDPASPEFAKLPLPTQYMILSHLRLRSRLRMGFSKEQLESLFPNSMDFSKFQIREVQKRNFFTQRLMDVSGMGENGNAERRIAGDKDRKYALTKNESGWVLKLQGKDHEGTISKPIDLDFDSQLADGDSRDLHFDRATGQFKRSPKRPQRSQIIVNPPQDFDDDDDDLELEDVPIEGDENDNVLKAIVESIYNQYTDGEQQSSKLAYEKDLKRAIEESKQELQALRTQEQTSTGGIFNWNNNFDDEMKSEPSQQAKRQKVQRKESSSSKPFDFSLGDSFLLGNKDKKIETTNEKSEPKQATTRPLPEPETESKKLPEVEEDEVEEIESQKSPINQRNEVPFWFNEEVSAKNNPYIEGPTQETSSRKQKELEDVAAGLIPWNEAKDIIEEEVEDEGGDDRESDVEIVDEARKVTEDEVKDEGDSDVEIVNEGENLPEVPSEVVTETNEAKESKVLTAQDAEGQDKRKAQLLDYDFEEDDEQKLLKQMRDEDADHERLKSDFLKAAEIPITATSISDEQMLQEQYNKAKRDSDEVTQTMIRDVQELLKRFGIPYITAPMEAEAQCAELMKLGLVDGIITDDSDCFLFGGQKVYKNMFNQKQYVECYFIDEISHKVGLDQKNLIELALLLGSDYTEGIKGIGPVMAVEILAEFSNLTNFKNWLDKNSISVVDESELSPLKKSLLNRVKNGKLFLPNSFPDTVVFDAYLNPEVDDDTTPFRWGVPNLDQIRSFLMYNVGWSQSRVDEVMVPLIRDMNRKKQHGTQSTIGEFFPQEALQSSKELAMGTRLKKATKKLKSKSS